MPPMELILEHNHDQNTYFNASCMMRGSAAATDLPNVWLFRLALGFIGLTWFGALNASTRNSNDCPSVTWNLRVKPRSKLIRPGPLNWAALPYPHERVTGLQIPVVC